ncbi:MAG: Ig-like domain-containing protein, partial [Casimicrobiaceae bacterium]
MRRLSALLAAILWSSIGLCDVPIVAMTYPPANATIPEAISPTILLQAAASDADEAVASVYFYVCPAAGSSCDATATMAGIVQASPYRLSWTPPHAPASGSLSIRYLAWATAVNSLGQSKISAAVPFTLLQPPPAPTIKLIAPSAPIGFAAPAAPVLYATAAPGATLPSSTIARVDFLDGQDVIGTVTSPNSVPEGYAYLWLNAALGPHQISARATDTLGDSASAPPVTLYIFPADQAPQVALTSPDSGQTFNGASTISLAATATSSDRSIQRIEFVAGNDVVATAFTPPYAASWVGPPPGNYAIVARAFDDLGVAAASPAAYVWVTAGPRPPAVVMTAPTPGSMVPANSPLPLAATAVAPDGGIGRIDFYAGTKLLGSSATAPYGVSWTTPGAGAASLTAKAYDLQGHSASSTPVGVTVSSNLPSVSLTAPAAGARLSAPATIALSASASENGGNVATVEFYANGALVATLVSPPYNAVWSNVAVGAYSLTAKAIDSVGATKTSAAVAITVVN